MKKIIFSVIFFVLLGSFNVQKTDAKVWTKDLVDKVVLTSGYKFQICPVASIQSAADIVANLNLTKEEEFVGNNPNSIECTGNKEEFLLGNTNLYFNLTKWPDAGNKPAKELLIVFRDKMYSIQGSGSQYPSLHAVNEDLIATNPGLKNVKKVGINSTDPNDYNPNIDNTIKDSALTVFYNQDGKFSTFLFVYKGQVYKEVAIMNQVTVDTMLVDYTQSTFQTPIPTSDSMADWKTYENTKYGLKLKYPSSLQTRESYAPSLYIHFVDTTKTFAGEGGSIDNPYFYVTFFPYTGTLDSYISNPQNNVKLIAKKTISGNEFAICEETVGMGINSSFYLRKHNDYILSAGDYQMNNNALFEQILSTFKSTN